MKEKDNNLLEEDVLSSDYVDDTQEIPFVLETPEERAKRRKRERIRKREEQQKKMNNIYTFATVGIGLFLAIVLFFLIKTTFFGKEKTPIKSDLYQIHTSDGLVLNYDGDNEEATVTSFTLEGIKKYVKEKHGDLSKEEQSALSKKLHREVKAIVTPGKNLSNGDKVLVEFDYSKYFDENDKDKDYEFVFTDTEMTVSGLKSNDIVDAFEGVEFYYKRFTGIGIKSGKKELDKIDINYQVVEYNETEDKIIVEATIVPKDNSTDKPTTTFENGKYVIQKLVSYETLPEGREDLLIPNSIKGLNDDEVNSTDNSENSIDIEGDTEDENINNNIENETENTSNENQQTNDIDDDFNIEIGNDYDSHSLPSVDENGNEINKENQDNKDVINIDNGNL